MEVDDPTPTHSPPLSMAATEGKDVLMAYIFRSELPKGQGGEGSASSLLTLDDLSLSKMTLAKFKGVIQTRANISKTESCFDVFFNGARLQGEDSTMSSFNIKPHGIVQVFSKKVDAPTPAHKSPSAHRIGHLSLALRTAFVSPAFARAVESLSNPETLEMLFAISPELRTDPVGIAIIQSPHMILQFSEQAPLKKLAEKRPWVLEALNYLAATVHGDRKSGGNTGSALPRGLLASQLLNPAMLGDDEEEEAQDRAAGRVAATRGGGQAPQSSNVITRDQLTQALQAIGNPAGLGGLLLGNLQPPPPRGINIQPSPTISPSQMSMASSQGTSSPSPLPTPGGTLLTGDMVARAMLEALNQLPPERREEQLSAFTDLARQVARGSADQPAPVAPGVSVPPTLATATSTALTAGPPPVNPQSPEADALRQLREVGIFDERLSLLALRVSGGDVGTAAELILSGWQGEGADDADADDSMGMMD